VDTGTGDDVAQEGKLGDASVLYLDVMEAVESLLVGAIKQAKGIEEAERGLGSELGLEGVEGRGSLGRRRGKGSGRSRKGGEGDTLKKKLSIEEVQDTFFVAITTHDPPLAHSISNSISSFSTTPHPTDKTAPDIPVELTTSFRLLGQPVGSATFATEFFDRRIDDVKKNVTSLLGNITDQQTRLRLFSQCIIQKIPHLLCRRSFSFTNRQPKPTLGRMERPTYLQHRLHYQSIFLLTTHNCEHYPTDIPKYSILISQLGIRADSLGILCSHTRAASDFVFTVASACRNALHSFRIHKDLPNFPIHQTIGALFEISTNTTSKILQRFHPLLPHIAEVACTPSIPLK
jgi:hypothetical protein